jgi:hypothetical protein
MPSVIPVSHNYKLNLSDTINISDSVKKDNQRALSDTINITDAISKSQGRTFIDTLELFDAFHSQKMKSAATLVTDFSEALDDISPSEVTLRKEEVNTDSLGNVSQITKTDITLTGYFVSTSYADKILYAQGESLAGMMTGYFEPSYTVSEVNYAVEEGDLIIRNSISWRVIAIEKIYRAGNEEIYLKEVDIYRVYNDTDVQATLIYEPSPSCNPTCQETTIGNCVYVRDNELGEVVYNPRLLTEPDIVELYYYSGYTGSGIRPYTNLDTYWRYPVAYLAASLLDREPRNCCGGNESFLVSQWKEDVSKSDEKKKVSYFATQRQIENQFGISTKGAWYAYLRATAKKLV